MIFFTSSEDDGIYFYKSTTLSHADLIISLITVNYRLLTDYSISLHLGTMQFVANHAIIYCLAKRSKAPPVVCTVKTTVCPLRTLWSWYMAVIL